MPPENNPADAPVIPDWMMDPDWPFIAEDSPDWDCGPYNPPHY
jgi:hypothetical protein